MEPNPTPSWDWRIGLIIAVASVALTLVGINLYQQYEENKRASAVISKYAPTSPEVDQGLSADMNAAAAIDAQADHLTNDMAAADAAIGQTGSGGRGLGITMAAFNAIDTGMSLEEVQRLIGYEGNLQARTEIPGLAITWIYSWQRPDGGNFSVTFQNGRVVGKAQAGLA